MLKIKIKTRPKVYLEVKQALENGVFSISEDNDALYVLCEVADSREAIIAKRAGVGVDARVILSSVEYIETEGHFLRLITTQDSFIVRKTLTELIEMLPHSFMRISSSTIVNMDKVVHISVIVGMRFKLTMKSGRNQFVSRSYYMAFKRTVGY